MKSKKILITALLVLIALLIFGVTTVNATTEYEENLIKKIAPDGQNATFKSVKPTSDEDAYGILTCIANSLLNENDYYAYAFCNGDDYTQVSVAIITTESGEPIGEYDINVTYDEPTANQSVKTFMDKMKDFNPEQANSFYKVTDLGLINYYMTSTKSELWNAGAPGRALKYSDDVIKLTNGSNISFYLTIGGGEQDDGLMYESAFGPMIVNYNGYTYGLKQQGLHLKRIIYIPQSTAESTTEYAKAAQKRINDYLGKEDAVTVVYGGTLDSLEEGYEDILVPRSETDGNYYNVTIKGKTYKFYIMKADADKLAAPTYVGNDIKTNITVTTNSSSVPLDTYLTVNSVRVDNIEELIGTSNYEAFDIKLYSSSKGASIERLENGKFLVSIPVSSALNGKQITVYYLDSNNKTQEYETVVEGGFAKFETEHFSTYILAEKVIPPTPTPTPTPTPEKQEEEKDDTPKTGSKINNCLLNLILDLIFN